jgi:hypothetical protein
MYSFSGSGGVKSQEIILYRYGFAISRLRVQSCFNRGERTYFKLMEKFGLKKFFILLLERYSFFNVDIVVSDDLPLLVIAVQYL